uniref:VPS9 domain-containing protein n=1 Tax=Clastoptera arizonana TaxID=38151 RepID=A0A1B6BY78_9HEMI
MNSIHIWKDIEKLSVTFDDNFTFPDDFLKISSLKDYLFLLACDHTIWHGKITSDLKLFLKPSHICAVDIACTNLFLYFVDSLGKVFKVLPESLEICTEIVFREDAKCCIHGYTTANQNVVVKKIAAGGMGVIYLSENGYVWASGEHPQIDIHNEDEPKKVLNFEGRYITSIACGKDFNVIVGHRRDENCDTNNVDNCSEDGEVFVSTCPKCINESIASPLSPQLSSDICPFGLAIQKSNESLSISTSTSKNNTIGSECKKSDNDNSSSSTEDYSVPVLNDNHLKDISEGKNIKDCGTDNEKGDRMSLLLINTEAARQFLTRQLSWVSSGGEELVAEFSVPTRIIKQNVSTMANLVYEGVKTVGDKVATLSRHVSGGSENNSESFEEFNTDELQPSEASNSSSIRCEWSFSGVCSEISDREIAERIAISLNRGSRLVKTEVWTWGNCNQGILGIGDGVRRHRPITVPQLIHIGVKSAACGMSHCVVLTITGRCLIWGQNELGQVNSSCRGTDFSSPIFWGRASQAAVGRRHTLLLASDTSLHWLGKDRVETLSTNGVELGKFELLDDGTTPHKVLSSGDISCCISSSLISDMAINSDLTNEQCFLEDMLTVQNTVLKPLGRKSNVDDIFIVLSGRYIDILNMTAINVAKLSEGMPTSIVLQAHAEEFFIVYEKYLVALCDVIAMSGFAQLSRSIEIQQKLISSFADRLPTRKNSPEAVLSCAFSQPLSRVTVYKMMLSRDQNSVSPVAHKWETFNEHQEQNCKQAECTRLFWESCGRLVESLRTPKRRLIRDSRSHPLSLHNASRFSSHWFILLNDAFVHITGTNHNVHYLETVWVESCPQDDDSTQNMLLITLPEETLTLVCNSPQEKNDWILSLHTAIKNKLNKSQVNNVRTASYTFIKPSSIYKDAKYTGRWLCGKFEGAGKLEWADGRVFTGQFHCNVPHGSGRLEIPGVSVYDGQWKDGLQNGYGCTRYENGEIFEGYYKDGLSNGHGMHKNGSFLASTASVYVGEWQNGLKHGYGVMDDIVTGEKYLGLWSKNLKNGCGLIVTLDGIYYEGVFVDDVLTGHGVMVFEDGTHYEGELREAGVFGGKGTLTFNSGDRFEGNLHGAWNEGVKISGTFHKNIPTPSPQKCKNKPSSFGKLCVSPNQKWKAIFRQCWVSLGAGPDGKMADTQRTWENIAVLLNSRGSSQRPHERLQTIPQFGRNSLDIQSSLLQQAFESSYHPLGIVLRELTGAYVATYGGVLVHPLLLSHAVEELRSITERLYQIVRVLFPALPLPGQNIHFGGEESYRDLVNMFGLLHPILLPQLHSALFPLYDLHNKTQDDAYIKRLFKWNKHPDITLMALLDIDKKFWPREEDEKPFLVAIETLQQLKTTFCPMEKMLVIQNAFQQMTLDVQTKLGADYLWSMDDLFPVFHFVVLRSCICKLGSEIHFIEDFMEPSLEHGELGIMFATLQACYFQILQEKVSIVS